MKYCFYRKKTVLLKGGWKPLFLVLSQTRTSLPVELYELHKVGLSISSDPTLTVSVGCVSVTLG